MCTPDTERKEMTEPSQIERIAKLEVQLAHVSATVDRMSEKVDELHNMLQAARGARWVLIGTAALVGFIGAKLGALAGFLGR